MSQTKNNPTILKISGISGVLTPFVAFTFILLAIAFYPQFSWQNNALSDLGVVLGVTSILFNTGLVLTGVLAFIFALGLFLYFKENVVGRIGTVFLALATLFLIAIGVFNENFSPTHYVVSVAFFSLLGVSLIANTVAFAYKRQVKLAHFTLILALIAAEIWLLYFTIRFVSGVAIPEFISGLAGAIWAAVLGYLMIKSAKD